MESKDLLGELKDSIEIMMAKQFKDLFKSNFGKECFLKMVKEMNGMTKKHKLT